MQKKKKKAFTNGFQSHSKKYSFSKRLILGRWGWCTIRERVNVFQYTDKLKKYGTWLSAVAICPPASAVLHFYGVKSLRRAQTGEWKALIISSLPWSKMWPHDEYLPFGMLTRDDVCYSKVILINGWVWAPQILSPPFSLTSHGEMSSSQLLREGSHMSRMAPISHSY